MAKKFYAVKKGRQVGVFTSWVDCEKQVKGYGGAIYKSFTSEEEAKQFVGALGQTVEEYFSSTKPVNSNPKEQKDLSKNSYGPQVVVAYIDGSFDKRLGAVGSGGIVFYEGREERFSFGTKDPAYTEFWNVSGELLAAMHVMKYALDVEAKECALFYDYMGIEMWATGAWKRNNSLTKSYAQFAQEAMDSLTLHFHKVPAHTGVTYNEVADQLAKEGLSKA